MVVARDAILSDALIFHRRFKHHALGQLVDHGALDFLPRRLACRILVAALEQCRPPPRQLRFRDQDVGSALAKIYANAISGEALRIDGEPDVPDCRPSPMQGRAVMPFLISAAGGCMFTTSAEPG